MLGLIAFGAVALCGYEIGNLIWAAATIPAHRQRTLIGIAIWALIGASVFVPVLLFAALRNPDAFPILCGGVFLLMLLAGLFTRSRSRAE
tara:strand:- start:2428 stop:2697 length:270 start_codon:yes stop_codon:yes gene_type:complete